MAKKRFTDRETGLLAHGLRALIEVWQERKVGVARRMFSFDGVPFTGDWDDLDALCAAEKDDPLDSVREEIAEVEKLIQKVESRWEVVS